MKWIVVPFGFAVFLFLCDWSGYRGKFAPWGDPRSLSEIWWHFPLQFILAVILVRLQQWHYWRNRVKPFSDTDDPSKQANEPSMPSRDRK